MAFVLSAQGDISLTPCDLFALDFCLSRTAVVTL